MLSDAPLYSQHHSMQERDSKLLLWSVIKKMDWSREEEDVVMDIGCGPGNCCRKLLLPSFPKVQKIIAVDVMPEMVMFARMNNAHEKIDYYVADIGDRDSMKKWSGQISKVISIYCFNWVSNHRAAFENVLEVLKPGGEAAFLYAIATPFYDAYFDLINDPKWKTYLENRNHYIPESYFKKQGAAYYRQMLKEVGFNVIKCEEEVRSFSYADDDSGKAALYSRCGLSNYIPQELKDEFAEDILKYVLKRVGRDSEGKPQSIYTALTLLLQKP